MLGSLPLVKRLNDALRTFSPFERLVLYALSITLALSVGWIFVALSTTFGSDVPARGGSFVEGAAGTARFVNPLLAASQSDHDLTTLVYSGLMRYIDGSFQPDLAEDYTVSEDGTEYTFHLREGITFHDGTPITANDVAFTITLAKNPAVKSPRRANWEGVEVSVVDERTVRFTLPDAYAPFMGNTTLGILPKHVWESVPADEFSFASLNMNPVGSGPFYVEDVSLDPTGAPTEYLLKSFDAFALGEAHIRTITYRLYPDEKALHEAFIAGDIDSFLSLAPKALPSEIVNDAHVVELPLARVFAIFFNQNHAPVLVNTAARQALAASIDRNALVERVLGGFGRALTTPIPPDSLSIEMSTSSPTSPASILEGGGWKQTTSSTTPDTISWQRGDSTLTFSLATADTPELVETAQIIVETWRGAGIDVKLETYPLSEFNQTVLRPRAYDAILFGEVLTRPLDLFAFWHSSQRNDPGLNLALYANASADKLLTDARAEDNQEARQELYRSFVTLVDEDTPAVFLYTPSAAYIAPSHIIGPKRTSVTFPAERFLGVYTWYRDTEHVWDFFTK